MIQEDFITLTLEKQKNIALIAHDNEKHSLIEWCKEHKDILSQHTLCGTGTTARMITDQTGLSVKGYNSGPLGGDQQIGAKIVEGRIDLVIFFSDPLTAQPHIPKGIFLLREKIAWFDPSKKVQHGRGGEIFPEVHRNHEHDRLFALPPAHFLVNRT